MNQISAQSVTAREQARSSDGKFGAQPHDRADGIDLAPPAAGRPEVFRDWDEVGQHLDHPVSLAREDAPDGTDLGYAQAILDRGEDGTTYLRLVNEYDDYQTSDPEFRAFMYSKGATTLDGSTYLSERIELDDLSEQSVDAALNAADEDRAFRLVGGGNYPEIGGFEEYARDAEATRRVAADGACGSLYERSLQELEEQADEEGVEFDQPNASDQLFEIEAGEREFLEKNWDLVQQAASHEGRTTDQIAQDIADWRVWAVDVTSDHSSPAFQELITRSSKEPLPSERAPVIDDNGLIAWE